MSPRLRLLILLALVVVIGGIAAAFFLGSDTAQQDDPAPGPEGTEQVREVLETSTPVPTVDLVDLVVAVQQINRGAEIPPNAVDLRPFPRSAAAFSSVTSLEDVIGKRARTDIYPEQQILDTMVVDDLADLASVGSDASAIIPTGNVAIAVPMDRLTSVAYAIQPGDRVDIIVSLLYVDIDEEFQSILPNNVNVVSTEIDEGEGISLSFGADLNARFETRTIPIALFNAATGTASGITLPVGAAVKPSEDPRPRLTTQRTIVDALVLHVGDFPADGRLFDSQPTPTVEVEVEEEVAPAPEGEEAVPTQPPPRPDVVTLAVDAQQAVILTYLIEARVPITFALRSAADTSRQPTDAVTLDYIMAEYDITVPPRREFSIQPAIRSIRQLAIGNEIALTQPNSSDN
jgi:Flp pilus assembly protein CpaB